MAFRRQLEDVFQDSRHVRARASSRPPPLVLNDVSSWVSGTGGLLRCAQRAWSALWPVCKEPPRADTSRNNGWDGLEQLLLTLWSPLGHARPDFVGFRVLGRKHKMIENGVLIPYRRCVCLLLAVAEALG